MENKTNVTSWVITDARVQWKLHWKCQQIKQREPTKRQIAGESDTKKSIVSKLYTN